MAKILIRKWPKWLFLENVMAKITKCFNYGNFHIHRCLKLFGRQYKKCDFAKEAIFYLKTAISSVNLKLLVTTCLY